MAKNNLSFWQIFLKRWKITIKPVQEFFQSCIPPWIFQNFQLICIYAFALIDLCYNVLKNLYGLGYSPTFLESFQPLIEIILTSPFLQIWSSPDKIFLLSYLVLELMVIRSAYNPSKLVQYNILLLFALLMIQSLVISYWDLAYNRSFASSFEMIKINKSFAIVFFLILFIVFSFLYFSFFIQAIGGKFGKIPGFSWLTDSVFFWLRMKTPTMKLMEDFEKESKDEDPEDDQDDENADEKN